MNVFYHYWLVSALKELRCYRKPSFYRTTSTIGLEMYGLKGSTVVGNAQ